MNMKGTEEFSYLFETGQYGKLYIVSGNHARGNTFHIYVLPAGVDAVGNGRNNPPLNPEAVEIYGVVGGNPGWTEYYGWLHKGKWQEDFLALVEKRKKEISEDEKREYKKKCDNKAEKDRLEKYFLSKY
jgi:hypothetical protein